MGWVEKHKQARREGKREDQQVTYLYWCDEEKGAVEVEGDML